MINSCRRAIRRFVIDRGGAVSIITALALPALIAALALGTEVSYWLVESRGLQNAADSAVIAATIDASANYLGQAKAVAARYGFVDGTGGVTVTASNAATCPAGGATCYSVKIATVLPTYLGRVVGYVGNGSVGGVSGTNLSAVAFAKPSGASHDYCVVALASNGTDPAIQTNGAPMADLSGCGTMSNTSAQCNGHDLGANFGDAVGTDSGCGMVQDSNVKPFTDPYSALAAKLPVDACGGSYPQGAATATTRWSGSKLLGSLTTVCGDLLLTADVTITAPSDAILVIRNGSLATQGFRFTVASGSGLAVIFTGVSSASYQHIPTGSGSLDLAAPTTGTWAGVALYQDPALSMGVQMPQAAGAPSWAISGLIYVPHVDLTFSGSVGKGSTGKQCTVIVANSLHINGTGLALSTVECGTAGLSTPNSGSSGRGVLVG